MEPPLFEISKWYMDCVSPDGDALVAYSAEMRWRRISLAYQAALELRGGQAPSSYSSLQPDDPPVVQGDGIAWHSSALGIYAAWTGARGVAAVNDTIFQSSAGSVAWACLLPAGPAVLSTQVGRMAGYGYVEHLHVTLPPWRLPISSLRWGRIADEHQSIVWIQWLGEFETSVAYVDGVRAAAIEVGDDRLALADGTTIHFDRRRVLREGALGATLAGSLPMLHDIAPVRMLATRECKWLSEAAVERPGRPPRRTWAIHELVRWPRARRRLRA